MLFIDRCHVDLFRTILFLCKKRTGNAARIV